MFITQNHIQVFFWEGWRGWGGWAVARRVIYIVEKHIWCSFPHLCMSDSRAEACGLSRILNAALTMKLGGTSRSHRRALCEWESERKKKRRGGTEGSASEQSELEAKRRFAMRCLHIKLQPCVQIKKASEHHSHRSTHLSLSYTLLAVLPHITKN